MDEKMYRAMLGMLLDNETHSVREKKDATALTGHELASSAVGSFALIMPLDRGMLVEYHADMALSTTLASYANPTLTPETGTPIQH